MMRTRMFLFAAAGLIFAALGGCERHRHGEVRAHDDTAAACNGSAVTIDVLANDQIPDNVTVDAVAISRAPSASSGTAVVNADNTITFTPAADATGQAKFAYQINYHNTSGSGDTRHSEADVFVNLLNPAQPPTAGDDTATVAENSFTMINVLANDSGNGLKLTSVVSPTQQGGTAAISDGQIQFTPQANFSGTDTFQYTITDACGTTATGNVSVTVTPVPLPPAQLVIINDSTFQITVFVAGTQVDIVQPNGSTVVADNVTAGANEGVRVEALLPSPAAPRETSTTFTFNPDTQYTLTYTDDNTNPATIGITSP